MWPSEEWRKPRAERRPETSFKDDLFYFLRERWAGLFGSTCEVVLFDLTSTYFEVDGTKALESDLQRYGYCRDKRGDCLQVVIALVLTPDGFPLAYEVLPGNAHDKGAQMPFIRKPEAKYGKIGNLWLMDRGVPTDDTLEQMRESGYRYLVGARHGHLKAIGDKIDKAGWEEVQKGISVKVVRADGEDGRPSDTFVLTRSEARSLKETSMRAKKIRGAMKTLFAIDAHIGRATWKAGRAWGLIALKLPKANE